MGLDIVEILIETEESFGITISDEAAGKIETVGDLYSRVREQRGATKESGPCLSVLAFHRLRHAAKKSFGVSRSEVRLDASLDDLLGNESRIDRWAAFREEGGLRLPELVCPGRLFGVIMAIVCLGAITSWGAVATATGSAVNAAPIAVALTTALVLAIGMFRLTRRMHDALPGEIVSIRDLASSAVTRNLATLARLKEAASEREEWSTLVQIIVNTKGFSSDEIRTESRFVKDLGLG